MTEMWSCREKNHTLNYEIQNILKVFLCMGFMINLCTVCLEFCSYQVRIPVSISFYVAFTFYDLQPEPERWMWFLPFTSVDWELYP